MAACGFANHRLKAMLRATYGLPPKEQCDTRAKLIRLAEPLLPRAPFFEGELPDEIWRDIASYLPPIARLAMSGVSARLRKLFHDTFTAAECLPTMTFAEINQAAEHASRKTQRAMARMLFVPGCKPEGQTGANEFVICHPQFAMLVPGFFDPFSSRSHKAIAWHVAHHCAGHERRRCTGPDSAAIRAAALVKRQLISVPASAFVCSLVIEAARELGLCMQIASSKKISLSAMHVLLNCMDYGLPAIVSGDLMLPVKVAARLNTLKEERRAVIVARNQRIEHTGLLESMPPDALPLEDFAECAKSKCSKMTKFVQKTTSSR